MRKLWIKRVLAFIAGLLLNVISATLYGFGSYSSVLKRELGFSNKELNAISTSCAAASILTWLSGAILDHGGPTAACLWGGAWFFLGWLGVWFQYVTKWTFSPVPLAVCYFIIGHAGSPTYLAALAVNAKNCSERYRPLVTGLLVTTVGGSGMLLSFIYKTLFSPARDLFHFFMMLMVVTPTLTVIGTLFLFRVGPPAPKVQAIEVPAKVEDDKAALVKKAPDQELEKDPATFDISGTTLLRDVRFYAIYSVFLFTISASVTFITNSSLVFIANGIAEKDAVTYVTLTGVMSTSGRPLITLIAFALKLLPAKRGLRAVFGPTFLLMVLSATISAMLILLVFQGPFLIIASLVLPLAFGGVLAIIPVLIYDTFGSKHYGTNFGILYTGAAIGSVVFGQTLGAIYDHFAGGSNLCRGKNCFSFGFLVLSVCCSVGTAFCALLWITTFRRARDACK